MGGDEAAFVRDAYMRPASGAPGEIHVRERILAEGAGALSDAELLAALLGTGTKRKGLLSLATDLLGALDEPGSILDPRSLMALEGMGEAKACLLAAAIELGRRRFGPGGKRVRSPSDIYPLIAHYAQRRQECFISLTLNGAHEVLACRVVSMGLVNRTVVHPREVFADAIVDRACAIVVAHNHPSGKLDPSPEDRSITDRLKKAGEILGIGLLDHLIFGESGYYSFVEGGLLSPFAAD